MYPGGMLRLLGMMGSPRAVRSSLSGSSSSPRSILSSSTWRSLAAAALSMASKTWLTNSLVSRSSEGQGRRGRGCQRPLTRSLPTRLFRRADPHGIRASVRSSVLQLRILFIARVRYRTSSPARKSSWFSRPRWYSALRRASRGFWSGTLNHASLRLIQGLSGSLNHACSPTSSSSNRVSPRCSVHSPSVRTAGPRTGSSAICTRASRLCLSSMT